MESMDYWRLCDEFSIAQAALLIVGLDPADYQFFVEELDEKPQGYEAAKAALVNAIQGVRLETANIKYEEVRIWDDYREAYRLLNTGKIDLHQTSIGIKELRIWLMARGVSIGFFEDKKIEFEFLDVAHEFYAPKLAASYQAWRTLSRQPNLEGKSPKQAMKKWLREHAADYGLLDSKGVLNELGITECAKVANWLEKGGVPKTPA